jgi:CelD/BcsL family acetyltransferase involved in cellulose biosynthesis
VIGLPRRAGPLVRPGLAPASAGGRLIIELKRDLDLAPDDAAALDALIDNRPHVGVFLSRAWLSGYFVEPPPGSEPFLLMFREGTAVRGIVPVAIRRTNTLVHVGLLGGGSGSDRIDLLAERGFEAECADRLLAWLGDTFGRRGFVLELRDACSCSAVWGAVHRYAQEAAQPLALEPKEVFTLPYLDLAEARSMYAGGTASESVARAIGRHRRWLEQRGRLTIEVLRDRGDVLSAYESLVDLLRARWQGGTSSSAHDHPPAIRFHRHVLPLLLAEGRLRMIRVTSELRTVAVCYGIATAGWWGCYSVGYDRTWAGRIHLGQLGFAVAIEVAAQEGAAVFDFLKGAEPVKYRWPVRDRITIDADVYSARSAPQFARARQATRTAAAAYFKCARGLFPTSVGR